jgi:hypothetical protein
VTEYDGTTSSQAMDGWSIAASRIQHGTISVPFNGQPLVTIHPDGRLEFRDGYTPDEAAASFWEAVQCLAPDPMTREFGAPLKARINAELGRLQRAREWVNSEPVTAATEFGNGYREALRDLRDIVGDGTDAG